MNISEANATSRVLRYLIQHTTATSEVKDAARHLAKRSYSALMAGVTPGDIDKWASVDDLLNAE